MAWPHILTIYYKYDPFFPNHISNIRGRYCAVSMDCHIWCTQNWQECFKRAIKHNLIHFFSGPLENTLNVEETTAPITNFLVMRYNVLFLIGKENFQQMNFIVIGSLWLTEWSSCWTTHFVRAKLPLQCHTFSCFILFIFYLILFHFIYLFMYFFILLLSSLLWFSLFFG